MLARLSKGVRSCRDRQLTEKWNQLHYSEFILSLKFVQAWNHCNTREEDFKEKQNFTVSV